MDSIIEELKATIEKIDQTCAVLMTSLGTTGVFKVTDPITGEVVPLNYKVVAGDLVKQYESNRAELEKLIGDITVKQQQYNASHSQATYDEYAYLYNMAETVKAKMEDLEKEIEEKKKELERLKEERALLVDQIHSYMLQQDDEDDDEEEEEEAQ